MKKIGAAILAMVMAFSFAGCKKPPQEPVEQEKFNVVCEDLTETDLYQERWLSIPKSRLVLNPFNFNKATNVTQSAHSNRAYIPLNVGYMDPYGVKKLGRDTTVNDAVMMFYENGSVLSESKSYSTSWRPDKLGFEAAYGEGALSIKGYDFLIGEKTAARYCEADGAGLAAAGAYKGAISQNGTALNIVSNFYKMSISFSSSFTVTYFSRLADVKSGNNALATAPAQGYWRVAFDKPVEILQIALTVDSKDTELTSAETLSQDAVKSQYGEALAARTLQWNRFFSKVPEPNNYDMLMLEENNALKEVTQSDVKQDYYVSWALIYSGILPPNPEREYNYYQVACGKPSMWDEGDPKAAYSASWESFFGIQLLSYIEPEIAWSAYKGMMTLVGESGRLGGESLPPENAHTAWVCYQNLPDKQSLLEIYPALKRHLVWRRENPRWIHTGHDIANEKDYDFASILMMDIGFAVKISEELDNGDAQFWKDMSASLYEDIKAWFFTSERSEPYQYNTGGVTVSGATAWVVKSLFMPALDGEYLTRTKEYLNKNFNYGMAFGGLSAIKYDCFAYTSMGLIKHGDLERGTMLMETGMRDIVLSKFLGEAYYPTADGIIAENKSACGGVRPSIFGAAIMIESVLLTNGFYKYDGGIGAANLYDRVSTVKNIVVDGVSYELTMDGLAGKAYLRSATGILTVDAPRGKFVNFDLK